MYLFTVADTFEIRQRGLILVPGIDESSKVKIGDRIELRLPDGTSKISNVSGVDLCCPHKDGDPFPILVNDLSKADIPVGTEVWSVL